jgi:gluconolactonase
MAEYRTVATGLRFPEGPVAMADGSVLVVEIARGTLTRVAADGSAEVVAECGGGPNGAAVGPDGAVYVCNSGGFEWHDEMGFLVPGDQPDDYAGGSVQRVDVASGEVTTLYTECGGHPLRGPNDLVFDGAGGFWFTDHGKVRPRDRDRGGLYWARADGSEIREVVYPLDSPNGVGLSPACDRVYVTETYTCRLWAWELTGQGEVARRPIVPGGGRFVFGSPALQFFDSLAVEEGGNVCVATILNGGVIVLSPSGEVVEHVPLPDPIVTNLCFAGEDRRTAFVTGSATGVLWAVDWARPGLAPAHG